MSACRDVQVWMTSEVQVPVMGFLERLKELCEEARQRIEERVQPTGRELGTRGRSGAVGTCRGGTRRGGSARS